MDVFYQEDAKVRSIIEKVGNDFDMNTPEELWLNNNVASMNKVSLRTICEKAYSYSNLIVFVPPLSYILGMKLESGRDRDRQDAGDIIKLVKVRSSKETGHTLTINVNGAGHKVPININDFKSSTDRP